MNCRKKRRLLNFFSSLLFIFVITIVPKLNAGKLNLGFVQPYFIIGESSNYNIYLSSEYKDANAFFEYGQINDSTYFNYETNISKKWKYFMLKNSRIYITNKIDRISVEGAFRYKIEQNKIDLFLVKLISNGYWNIGIRQNWDRKIPNTNVFILKEYNKKLKFFLTPAELSYSVGFSTDNLKKWKKQSRIQFDLSIMANLDVFILSQIMDDLMSNRFGLGLKF